MLIIGFTGLKRSGKDTAVNALREEYGHQNVQSYAFAEPLYDMLDLLLQPEGFPLLDNGEVDKNAVVKPYNVTIRHMLQTLGTEWGRECIHPDVWVLRGEELIKSMAQVVPDLPIFVFSDVRFNNEADMIRENGGYIIRIRRPNIVPKARTFRERLTQVFGSNEDTHASENGIAEYLIDETIDNNGTLMELQQRVLRTVAMLRRRGETLTSKVVKF